MNKYLASMYLLLLTIGTIFSVYMPKVEPVGAEGDLITIPQEAIRLRILANSDLESDQSVKRLIRDAVNLDITEWVGQLTSIDEAREVISSHIPEIQATAERIIAEQNMDQTVSVNFGKADFPTKLYGQYLYKAGEYEAVVIKLGSGEGANWWCVLFPPLCFLDFSNGTAVSMTPIVDEEATTEVVEEVQAPTEAVKVKEDVVTTKENVYIGEEEPIQVKSLFAELFASLF